MKKLIALVLAGIMTFSLAACGQNATGNQTTTQDTQNVQTAESQPAAAVNNETTAEPMELTMYFPVAVGGGPDALIDALCAQYHEENPNITLSRYMPEAMQIPVLKYRQPLRAATHRIWQSCFLLICILC